MKILLKTKMMEDYSYCTYSFDDTILARSDLYQKIWDDLDQNRIFVDITREIKTDNRV